MVCRLSSRDRRGRLPGARGRADGTSRGLAASDTVTGVNRPTDCSNAAEKPIKAETMATLVLPPFPLIYAACKATLLTLPRAAGWISNRLRTISRTSGINPAIDLIVATEFIR